ncbi:MAG: shikimate dehydrogenase [Pseudomonadota bacterium]
MTDYYAVIGNPVAHSKSPLIHAAFARQTGEALIYDTLYAELDEFESVVQRFRDTAGCGLNVTVPFKHRAYAFAQRKSARAEQASAVNTLRFDQEGVFGDNTDGVGLVRDLTQNIGYAIDQKRVLLMGAGGASYGVCAALLAEHPAALVVVNRTFERANALVERFRDLFPQAPLSASGYEALEGRTFDLIVNATSAGLSGAMPVLASGVFGENALAYDMTYAKASPFLSLAGGAGATCADGLGMLVEQAAESFYVWRGVRPDTAPVIELLRREHGLPRAP